MKTKLSLIGLTLFFIVGCGQAVGLIKEPSFKPIFRTYFWICWGIFKRSFVSESVSTRGPLYEEIYVSQVFS
jgi:hypothetical protein